MPAYLTQPVLHDLLRFIYPDSSWVIDKPVPGSLHKTLRPDYRCDDLKMIVEFDGYGHFYNSDTIVRDRLKDTCYLTMGYKVVRIPYFIQPSTITLKLWFDVDIEYQQRFPHGFIDKKSYLPANYCWLGIGRFTEVLNHHEPIKAKIIESLKVWLAKKPIAMVLPEPLYYLFDQSLQSPTPML